jgi:hypothetical protein
VRLQSCGQTSSVNLVLQGDPSSKVFYDPLAPAFHGNVFNNKTTREAQNRRTTRVINSLQSALETGEISPVLRKQIFEGAEKNLSELPAAKRLSAERQRLYMRELKGAIESGLDIRTMPQLFNYLFKEVQSNLYREKDGFFQPALEDAFRVAIDTEQSFYAGRTSANTLGPILGSGRRSINVQGQAIDALEFQLQGHKMLFAGNAALKFKHALGGFDLDDKGIVMPRVFQDASGNERLSTFIFRQPTGPAEFIFAMPKFGSSDTIKMFLENNDALMEQLDSVKDQDQTFDLIHRSLTAKGTDKKSIDILLANLAESDLVNRPDKAGSIEGAILDLMSGAQTKGLYTKQFIKHDDQIMEMLRREGGGVASPLELTKERVEELISKGSKFVDEQFLVNQYNYGSILRVFKEAGEFNFLDETQSELRQFFGDQTGKIYTQEEIGEALSTSSGRKARKLQAIIESDYQKKAIEALSKKENIGQYINKMLIATASSDQEQNIVDKLRAKGLGSRVDDIISKTTAGIISPSDVVDIVTNLSGDQYLLGEAAVGNQYQVLKELMDNNGPEATLAVERILKQKGYQDGKSLSQNVADAAIQAKFERIGRLRAMALEAGMSGEDLAGIDPEFIKARLKSPDALNMAIDSLREGFVKEAGNTLQTNEAMKSYISEIDLAKKANDSSELNEQVIRIAGMATDSKFAHASAMAKIGKNNKDAVDALSDSVNTRRTTQYLGEINTSREATTIAENILNEYSRLSADSEDVLSNISAKTGAESESFIYEGLLKKQQVGEQLRSMIYAGVQGTQNTTVQDILDNMERLSNTSRFRGTRGYEGLLSATGDENDIRNLVYGSQRARELKFLRKQENIESLANQLDDMIAQANAMSTQDRADILRQSRDVLESHVRMNTSRVSDDHRLAAAFIAASESETGIAKMSLDEDTLLISRRILQFSNARRYLKDTGMEDILSYSGTGGIDLDDKGIDQDVRSRVLSGLTESDQEDDLTNLAQANRGKYKRITDSWRGGKLGEAFDNPIVKKSAYAAVGLIAASFIYSGSKDRGEQEISGPPLLPGGSAYENLPQRTPQIPDASMFSGYKPGVGYSVHIEGSRNQIEAFGSSARSVAKGPINSTMSRGLPQLGRDPYSEVASSF